MRDPAAGRSGGIGAIGGRRDRHAWGPLRTLGGGRVRIAIMGAGNVGGGLEAACAAVGHEIVYGVRDSGSRKTAAALEASSSSQPGC